MASQDGGGCGCDSVIGGDESADTFSSNFVVDKPDVTGGNGSLGSDVYTGTAVFGRVYATIGAVIGIIIAIILIFTGMKKLRDPHTGAATATVTNVDKCTSTQQNKITTYLCVIDASYVVGGRQYLAKGISVSRGTPVAQGSMLTLRHNPKDPASVVYEMAPKVEGRALIGLGLLIGGITAGIAVLTYKSKGFAAGYGAVEGLGMVLNR